MADIITDANPTTLIEFEQGCADKARQAVIHTVRDYAPIFDQMLIQRGNDGMGDRGSIITSYPEGQLRAFNEGWDTERAHSSEVRYAAGMMVSRSEVDKKLYDTRKESERDAWRLKRDEAFMRGLARSVMKYMFYGSSKENYRSINGLANIVVPESEAFGDRILYGGGTTANKQASIWLLNYDSAGLYGFYPENGGDAGLNVQDMGEHYAFDKNGKRFPALITEFSWDFGLAVYDPERVVRIANIDTTKLNSKTSTGTGANLIDLMIQAVEMMPEEESGRRAFYMNDTLRSVLRRQIVNKDNVHLSQDEIAGRKVLTFDGIPVHKLGTDVLTNTEAVVTAAS